MDQNIFPISDSFTDEFVRLPEVEFNGLYVIVFQFKLLSSLDALWQLWNVELTTRQNVFDLMILNELCISGNFKGP
jgi:hypothetical protein